MQAVLLATSVCAMPAQAQDTATKAGPASVTDTSETGALRHSSVVLEEEALPETRGKGAERDSLLLEPVIVTATKRPMALREVPASIGVISGELLDQSNVQSLADALAREPGVQLTEVNPEYNRIAIRGVQSDSLGVTPSATGYFLDDIPVSDPFTLHARPDLQPFDMEALEILKGPQGTLFGGSALAGALRYRMTDARPGAWESRGFLAYESAIDASPDTTAGLAGNVPLGDSAAVRLVGTALVGGGRINDLRNGLIDTDTRHRRSGRLLFRWQPSEEGWSVGIKAMVQASEHADLPLAETLDGRLERERALRSSPGNARYRLASIDFGFPLDWADIKLVTTGIHKNSYASGAAGARSMGIEDAGQPAAAPLWEDMDGISQELRFISKLGSSRWRWVAGLYWHRFHDLGLQRLYVEPGDLQQEVDLLNYEADVTASEFAFFGELSRRLGGNWTLTGGLRAYQLTTKGSVVSSGAIILATGSPENRNDEVLRAQGVSPKLALQYLFSDQASTYISLVRGFRFGGIQLIGPSPVAPDVPTTYEPDSLWHYEWGLNSDWFRSRLSLNLALFYIDWSNAQLQTTTGGAVPLNIIDNVGRARSQGMEWSLDYRPSRLPGLSLRIAGAYTDARLQEAYAHPSGQDVPAGVRLPGSALHQHIIGVDYRWSWSGQNWRLGLEHNRQGPGINEITQELGILDYATTGLRLQWDNPRWMNGARWNLAVGNLADRRALIAAQGESEDDVTALYNKTRSVSLRVDWEW